jgi:glycerol-3-phosphate acyltransferase PlsY
MNPDFSLYIYFDVAVVGYLVGSIPFGLILTRFAGLGDIRAIGSGNIGATNVLRTGNKWLALATLLLDGGKGAAVVLMVKAIMGEDAVVMALMAGIAAVVGHNFPIWLRGKGGKGVATTLGLMLAAAPLVGLLACVTWAIVAAIFRISSLAALIALLLAPIYAYALGHTPEAVAFAALGILVWVRHRANIQRLLKGEEPRIGAKKS